MNAQLSGPRLTDAHRVAQLKAQDPDMPPTPWWWDDDDDAAESSIMAARQLGLAT